MSNSDLAQRLIDRLLELVAKIPGDYLARSFAPKGAVFLITLHSYAEAKQLVEQLEKKAQGNNLLPPRYADKLLKHGVALPAAGLQQLKLMDPDCFGPLDVTDMSAVCFAIGGGPGEPPDTFHSRWAQVELERIDPGQELLRAWDESMGEGAGDIFRRYLLTKHPPGAGAPVPPPNLPYSDAAGYLALIQKNVQSKCTKCKLPASDEVTIKMCARCRSAGYCSRECQQADWVAQHKKLCPLLLQMKAGREYEQYEEQAQA